MAHSEEFWNSLYRAFDPTEILAGERGDSLYCEREYSPFDEMKQLFRPSLTFARPPVAYFTGHRGSGKSSLLFRFLEQRKTDSFVVYCDVEHNLDSTKANQIDLLFLVGAAIYQAGVQEKLKPKKEYLEALAKSVYAITYKEEEKPLSESVNLVELAKGILVFSAGVLGSKVGEKLAEALLKPITITTGVSEEIARKREVEPQVQEIVNIVNLIIGDVQTKAKKPLLVIIDGLDKIQRLEQAKLLFLDSRALRGPLCRIIYTVPMLIFTLPEFMQAVQDCKSPFLPNVKLFERLDTSIKDKEGYETMQQVITKRLALVALDTDTIFEAGVVDTLIHSSGGVMRYLISYTLSACMTTERMGLEKVNSAAVQQVVEAQTVELTSKLKVEHREELRKVRDEKMPSTNPISNELLHALFILAYRNGGTWYYPHPLLWNSL